MGFVVKTSFLSRLYDVMGRDLDVVHQTSVSITDSESTEYTFGWAATDGVCSSLTVPDPDYWSRMGKSIHAGALLLTEKRLANLDL